MYSWNASKVPQKKYKINKKNTYMLFFDEADEGCSLDFNWLTRPVVQRDHKVEEVGLSQIAGRLLLKVSSTNADAETKIKHAISRLIYSRPNAQKTKHSPRRSLKIYDSRIATNGKHSRNVKSLFSFSESLLSKLNNDARGWMQRDFAARSVAAVVFKMFWLREGDNS